MGRATKTYERSCSMEVESSSHLRLEAKRGSPQEFHSYPVTHCPSLWLLLVLRMPLNSNCGILLQPTWLPTHPNSVSKSGHLMVKNEFELQCSSSNGEGSPTLASPGAREGATRVQSDLGAYSTTSDPTIFSSMEQRWSQTGMNVIPLWTPYPSVGSIPILKGYRKPTKCGHDPAPTHNHASISLYASVVWPCTCICHRLALCNDEAMLHPFAGANITYGQLTPV